MHIRPVTQNDVESLSVLVSSLSHFYLNDNQGKLPAWFATTLTNAEFSKRINSPEFSNYLCEVDGSVAGYIAIKGDNHLYHLFVSEQYQGKGIARALWQHAIKNGNADSYTLRSSMYAVPVYKSFGFVESGPAQEKDGILFQPMMLHNS